MSLGPWQLIIIAIVILVLFGRGKISEMMGDFGKGIKSFKQGMNEEDGSHPSSGAAPRIEGPAHDAKAADKGLSEAATVKDNATGNGPSS